MPAGRDREPGVVEHRAEPIGVARLVARVARRREPCRDVVGVRRASVVRLVTRVAVARRALIDVVLVTACARREGVLADEGEETVVVEDGLQPIRACRVVARLTGRGEAGGGVVGILRAIVVGAVAAVAGPRDADVVAVTVTGRAPQRRVDADQRKGRMREDRLQPRRVGGEMADYAVGRKPRGDVIGRCRALVCVAMAAIAVRAGVREHLAAVTALAPERPVRGLSAMPVIAPWSHLTAVQAVGRWHCPQSAPSRVW